MRRESLLRRMALRGRNSGFILFLAHGESPINYPANAYPFRQDSNWLYFLGLGLPDMIALMDLDGGKTLLFGDEPSSDDLVWTGPRKPGAELAESCGAVYGGSIRAAEATIARLAAKSASIFHPPYCRAETKDRLASLLPNSRGDQDEALLRSIISLREIKEDEEIVELEAAVESSAAMHLALLSALKPGWTERQAASFVAAKALSEGCAQSFSTIATLSGHVLHNQPGDAVCGSDGFFLLDAGAERPSGYAGDLTTSFPIGPRFDTRRAALYDILLNMFDAACGTLGPGRPFLQVHTKACLALAAGLKGLGILKGDPFEAVEAGAHALFFPHGIGHMIGLDVHDMEGLGEDRVGYVSEPRSRQFGLSALRLAKPLAPGMVHSVEPGIYFIPWLIEAWKAEGRHAAFIDYGELSAWESLGGMRVEEDWLVLESGARRLGPRVDKARKAIEALRGG